MKLVTMASFLGAIVFVLVSVAFFTLLERKILGYSHERLGPNKVGFMGFLQPFSDALSLFSKEFMKLTSAKAYTFSISPVWGLMVSVLIWSIYPYWGFLTMIYLGWVALVCISSLSIYFLLLSGWASGSKFSNLGSYRSSSQTISYEVVFIIVILCLAWAISSYAMDKFYSENMPLYSLLFMPMIFCWSLSCFAETNRSPFDFSEGESELVSGFNTEFGGGLFSLIFIGEYSSILFLSSVTGLMFFGGSPLMLVFVFIMSAAYLWIRCSFPRLRYDKLMMMSWSGLLIYTVGVLGAVLLMTSV